MQKKSDQSVQNEMSEPVPDQTNQSSCLPSSVPTTTLDSSALGDQATSSMSILTKIFNVASCAGACLVKRWLQKNQTKEKEPQIQSAASSILDFVAVAETLDFAAIPEYASAVRQRQMTSLQVETTPWAFECTVESPPLHGSYNILFPILFGDRSKWLLKVPSDVQSWDEAAANNLRTEASTMKFLKGKGLPVPEVYAFDTSMDNSLKCPFILMEFLDGRPLYEGWFDDDMPEEAREALRRKCLESLASIMIQLNGIRHTKAGSPIYDDLGNITGVGSFRIPNPAEYDYHLAADFSAVATTEQNRTYCELRASDNEQAYLLSMLDRHPDMGDSFGFNQGANKLLRMFIDWGSTKHAENDFVLAHPDLDLQNILVDSFGNVTGLVDWDGVTMVPQSIGCSFPKWLSRDWDPNIYQWYSNKSKSDPSQVDHSPDQMNYYREMYAQCLEAALIPGNTEQNVTGCVDTVRQSVIFSTLRRAASRPRSFYWSLTKIVDLIGVLTSQASFKSAPNCVTGEISEGRLIEDITSYTGPELVMDAGHRDICPDSENPDKDSKLLRKETTTKDSASTTSSDSEGPSENSKSTCATILTSETLQLIKACTSHSAPVIAGVSPGQVCDLPVIEEASCEGLKTAVSLAQLNQKTASNPVTTASEASLDRKPTSKSAKPLRKVNKGLRLILRKWNRSVYQVSDSSGTVSVVVDNTIFDLMSQEKSCSAIEITQIPRQFTESKVLSNKAAVVQSSIAEINVSSPAIDNYKSPESSQFQLKSDQPRIAGVYLPVVDQSGHEDIRYTPRSRKSSSETSQNESITSSKANSSPDSTTPLIKRERKVGLARRMVHILASACETKDAESNKSIVSCKEMKNDHDKTTGASKTNRVKRWFKDRFHVRRTSDASSATSATAISTDPPHISRMSSFSALENPFEPGNETTTLKEAASVKKGSRGQYRITPSGTKAWDLQNLEPVDMDSLREEEFMTGQIYLSLAENTLDEARTQRLKAGFFALLDSL